MFSRNWEHCIFRYECLGQALVGQAKLSIFLRAVQNFCREIPLDLQLLTQVCMEMKKTNCYPRQSAKILRKAYSELNPPTRLDPTHQTTSFGSDQIFQVVRVVSFGVAF